MNSDAAAVIEAKNGTEHYLSHFERFERIAPAHPASWLLPLRKAAMARFAEMGFPTVADEDWRYTNVAPIAATNFQSAQAVRAQVSRQQVENWRLVSEMAPIAVLVNGRLAPSLCELPGGEAGATIRGLSDTLEKVRAAVEPHLARHVNYQRHAFTALNTSLMEDGAFVHVPDGKVIAEPIQLLYVTSADGLPVVTHPRNLVVIGENAQATIIETYVGLENETYFTNAVTEIVAGAGAVVDHYKVQHESPRAFHIGTLQLHQCRGSTVTAHNLSFGGGLVRHNINVVLDGDGGDCTLNGLYMVQGTQHVDNHLVVEHAKPHCHSREFFKGVLDGQGKGIFSGRIIVRKGAQKTDAKQTNKSLLLSEDAQVESKPQLEIFADDVKCTHGATIGQVSNEAVFYLRTRGIAEEAARRILVYAFAKEVLDQIRVPALSAEAEKWLLARIGPNPFLREGA